MDVVPVHFAAELNAWDEPQRLQRVKPRFVKMANAIHGIVIGNCQIGKSGRFSRGDDLFRCKPAVRKRRVDMHIAWHGFPYFLLLPLHTPFILA